MAALGLHCCARAFSSCGEQGLLFVAVRGLPLSGAWALGVRASVVAACGLSSCGSRALEHRLSICGARALLLCGLWDLPGPGLEPVYPALAGGFSTTAPPGKPNSTPLSRLGSNFLSSAKLFLTFCLTLRIRYIFSFPWCPVIDHPPRFVVVCLSHTNQGPPFIPVPSACFTVQSFMQTGSSQDLIFQRDAVLIMPSIFVGLPFLLCV